MPIHDIRGEVSWAFSLFEAMRLSTMIKINPMTIRNREAANSGFHEGGRVLDWAEGIL